MSRRELRPVNSEVGRPSGRKIMLAGATGLLVLSAIVMFLPFIRLALPLRLMVAAADVVAALTIWMLLRHQPRD